jgi:hypothetical protein
MSDPWLDNIEKTIENGDIPQQVNNRMVLAALRIMDDKLDTQGASCRAQGDRVTLLERWQSKANGAIAAAMFLAGGGLVFTVVRLLGI